MTVERHLVLQQVALHPSGEWTLPAGCWTVLRVAEGAGYFLRGSDAWELNPGDGFAGNGHPGGVVRASSLGILQFDCFYVHPQFLHGVLTVAEAHRLQQADRTAAGQVFIFKADHAIGQKFKHLMAQPNRDALPVRAALLQLWSQAVADTLATATHNSESCQPLRGRFRNIVGQMPDAELAISSLTELARRMNCSERHFSRLFREEFGVALRQRQTELRLLRARQLLEDGDAKIINVAHDSGYQHLGLFNTMFKRRFGQTPGEWRQKNLPAKVKKNPARTLTILVLMLVGATASVCKLRADSQDNPDQAAARAALVQKLFEVPPVAPKDDRQRVSLSPDPTPAKPAVTILVTASPAVIAEGNAKKTEGASTNAMPGFKVEHYLVEGNSLLPENEVQRVLWNTPTAFGTNVAFADIQKLLGELTMAYRERGFVTVSPVLPKQSLTNDTLKIKVIEGHLSGVTIKGNQYFSTENVLRALPSLHSNMMLNSHVFQAELDAANANRDRQIYPVISPGPEPGTTELTLKVKDRFPVHGRVEYNNSGTPGTPDDRVNANAQYGNLWGLEHQLGVSYAFTPLDFRAGSLDKLGEIDDPLIANYGIYYRIPLGQPRSVQRAIDNSGGQFGYNEITHTYNLPPATGRPEISFYGSRSVSDTGVQNSPKGYAAYETATNNAGVVYQPLSITTNSAGESITLNESVGSKFTLPLTLRKIQANISLGFEMKRFQQNSFNTNQNFFETQYYDTLGNLVVNTANAPQPQPSRQTGVDYFPASLGFNLTRPDKYGITSLNAQLSYNLAQDSSLSGLAYSAAAPLVISSNALTHTSRTNSSNQARNNYLKVQAGFNREQRLYKDWTVLLRADGQWASSPLFSNEQFAMGGTAGVRGYSEGEAYGDAGWRVSIEPRTPLTSIGMVDGDIPFWLRASVFMDYGQIYFLQKVSQGVQTSSSYWGVGSSLTANIGSHLDARLTMALPVLASALTRAWNLHVYFGVGGQF